MSKKAESLGKFNRSEQLFEEARRYLPGGVDSPVRAFKAVGGTPLFIKRGRGSKICDEDGNDFIDYVGSWGPLILGHAHPSVVRALKKSVDNGSSFGAPTELETQLAKLICEAMPSVQMVRFVTSGTEAAMSAIRLARAFTGRSKVLKFAGCYHGHSDGLLAKAGSGMATLGIPSSLGVPVALTADTLVEPYNNLESVEQLFRQFSAEIAAVIVEPIAGNMGVVLPQPGFLEGLRNLTNQCGALLIFDEVITGFRVDYGGAQELYKIKPDLTCLGKIIGGGLPVGAYGGRRDIMQMIAPSGEVYQAGTLSGNPLAMTAGIETLTVLKEGSVYQALEKKASRLQKGIVDVAKKAGVDVQLPRIGSMFTVFFTREPVTDYETACRANTDLYARFFHQMLLQGVYFPPSQFEAAFISTAHSVKELISTVNAASKSFLVLSR
jgi:glutamate-1-semialdehyde 2,1-aminomutase